jgi:hypothetical protein
MGQSSSVQVIPNRILLSNSAPLLVRSTYTHSLRAGAPTNVIKLSVSESTKYFFVNYKINYELESVIILNKPKALFPQ